MLRVTCVLVRKHVRVGVQLRHLDKVAEPAVDLAIGHSFGRWERDALVVDVTNFSDKAWLDRAGNFHSDALHLVERFTPITPDGIHYELTIEDPEVVYVFMEDLYAPLSSSGTLVDIFRSEPPPVSQRANIGHCHRFHVLMMPPRSPSAACNQAARASDRVPEGAPLTFVLVRTVTESGANDARNEP